MPLSRRRSTTTSAGLTVPPGVGGASADDTAAGPAQQGQRFRHTTIRGASHLQSVSTPDAPGSAP